MQVIKSIKIFILFFISIFIYNFSNGQIVFQAEISSNQVVVNQPFQVQYTIQNLNSENLSIPQNPNLKYLGNSGSSSNTTIINGNVTRTLQINCLFSINKTGKIVIPAAQIVSNGKKYNSNSIEVNVINGNIKSQQQTNSNSTIVRIGPNGQTIIQNGVRQNAPPQIQAPQSFSPQIIEEQKATLGKKIFLKTEVDKQNVYFGEQVNAAMKIYSQVPFSMGVSKFPKLTGFWNEDFDIGNPNENVTKEIINGQEYYVMTIKKTALFPQQIGSLKIDGVTVEGEAMVPKKVKVKEHNPWADLFGSDPFEDDPFFKQIFGSNPFAQSPIFEDDFYSERVQFEKVPLNLVSPIVSINVLPLPETSKPASYTGGVGKYRISSQLKKNKMTTDEVDTIVFTIQGKGNLKLITPPKIDESNIDLFDTYSIDSITSRTNEIEGFKQIIYSFSPAMAGKVKISPIEFSYFDLESKSYITLKTDSFSIDVSPGKKNANELALSHLRPLPIIQNHKSENTDFWISKSWTWAIASLPIVMLLGAFSVSKRKSFLNENKDNLKRKNANKVAIKRLQNAKLLLDKNENLGFYTEISNALWLYISDKSKINLSNINNDNVKEYFENKNIPNDIQNQFFEMIENSQMHLYASANMISERQKTYENSLDVIGKLENYLIV